MEQVSTSKTESWPAIVEAYRVGDLDKAEKGAKELVSAEPRHVQALHLLSVIAYRRKNPELELFYLKKVLTVDPYHFEALNGMANLLRAKGKCREAADLCRRILEQNRSYANAHNSLGLCQVSLGQLGDAVKSFHMALLFQPDLAAARQNLEGILTKLGKRTDKEREEALAPSSGQDYENLAVAQLALKKRKESIECLTKATELEPKSLRILIELADAKKNHGDHAQAVKLFHQALELDPTYGPGYAMLGFAQQDLGEFEDAKANFEKSLALNPAESRAYLGLVTGQKIRPEDYALVASMMALLAKNLPPEQRMYLHTALSKANDDLGNYQEAVFHMDEANRIGLIELGKSFSSDLESQEQVVQNCISVFTQERFARPFEGALDTELPIFIVGMPRSGTTLMEQVVSAHPQVTAGGELRFMGDAWSSANPGSLDPIGHPSEALALAEEYLALLKNIGPQASRVTDKMPDNYYHMGMIHLTMPKARFIHCRRNALDNAVSLYMTPFTGRPPFCYCREDIVRFRGCYEALMAHWHKVFPPGMILDVDYEEMVADQETQARRVIEFCGLPWDDACLRHEQNKRAVNTPSNWQTRQKIYKTSVERWMRYEPWLGALEALKKTEGV